MAWYGGITVTKFTCSAKFNYTDGSPYGNNVAELLSTLTGPSTGVVDNWWFRTATVGDAPNQASGLAMCFADTPDSDPSYCHNCLTYFMTSRHLLEACDHSRTFTAVSSDGCILRYADEPFLGAAAGDSSGHELVKNSLVNTSYGAASLDARRALLGQLAEKAGGDPMRFATGSQGFMVRGVWHVMYGMAQCTRDLHASECTGCLVDLLAVMYRDVSVTNSTEASVMGFSCYLRYQMDEPINVAGMALPPSQPPPPATHPTGSASPSTGGKMTTVLIAAAAVTLLITATGV
ncbi:hypothetical protein HU200_034762 [Digitaria exilis]|uniref:Gnk2-homologous domain-containing protein n=1 Tax=Digitaria exilis TaxID=1010633 RepID=A0A835BHB9_9POAL|nr:hypothetical protein HU200_034762 [Digitaria exilis]